MTSQSRSKMKPGNPSRKIDGEFESGQYVTPDQKVVRWWQRREPYDLQLESNVFEADDDLEELSDNWFAAGFMDCTGADWCKIEGLGKAWAYTRVAGAGVDHRNDGSEVVAGIGPDTDESVDRWAILDEIIDRLAKMDLGPSRFFIIGHRSPSPPRAPSRAC